MFDLKTPCNTCPFRKDRAARFALTRERILSFIEAPAFTCHKTVDYTGDEPVPGPHAQQCAGRMALLHREGRPDQIMQVATRLGHLHPTQIDPDGIAVTSIDEMIALSESSVR